MEVSPELLMVRIKSMELQIAGLKAQVKRMTAATPPRKFSDLYGILADAGDFTEEEIDAALYRLDEADLDWLEEPAWARA